MLFRLTSPDDLRSSLATAGPSGAPMSLGELANLSGCSKSMIGHLLSGRSNRVNHNLAARIEWALRVDPGSLFIPDPTTRIRPRARRAVAA